MFPLGRWIGYPIQVSGARMLLVRVSEVPYPNVFINRTGADHKPKLAHCLPERLPRVYAPSVYAKIPVVTLCSNAQFLCQINCPNECKHCKPQSPRA